MTAIEAKDLWMMLAFFCCIPGFITYQLYMTSRNRIHEFQTRKRNCTQTTTGKVVNLKFASTDSHSDTVEYHIDNCIYHINNSIRTRNQAMTVGNSIDVSYDPNNHSCAYVPAFHELEHAIRLRRISFIMGGITLVMILLSILFMLRIWPNLPM